ncbi:MAG: hypothetical protein PHW87_11565, partial [Methanothrix sp.]|nr:hypothetical protein [Methanothrix sp.]
NFTLMPTSRNTWRGKAFLLRVDQKRIGVPLNRRVKIELAKTDEASNDLKANKRDLIENTNLLLFCPS